MCARATRLRRRLKFIALFAGGWIASPGLSKDLNLESYCKPPRCKVVQDTERKINVLEITYPKGGVGSSASGSQWRVPLDKSYEHLTLSYEVKFGKNFAFVKGGKLPGLVGGHQAGHPTRMVTGGNRATGDNGWSARIMWRREGRVVQYVYHPDQPSSYGQDFPWKIKGEDSKFIPGRWHQLKTKISMNTLGSKDGIIRSWFDTTLALDITNIRFRTVKTLGIDTLYFSTFFGGSSLDWAPAAEQKAYFVNFVVSEP